MDDRQCPPALTLTRAELTNLTGYGQPKRMAEWLTERGWVFEPAPRRGDVPRVDRAYYLCRMSGAAPGRRREGPRLDWMTSPRRTS